MIIVDPTEKERRDNWLALGALFLVCSVFANVVLVIALAGMQMRC